jgi:hypothetical protein
VCQADEHRLLALGWLVSGPGFAFESPVFDFVEYFLNIPAQFIEKGDKPRRDRMLIEKNSCLSVGSVSVLFMRTVYRSRWQMQAITY